MKCVLVNALSVLYLAGALAAPPQEKGLIVNLDNGELCFISMQCKSSCCHRPNGLSLARCAPKAAENQKCSKKIRHTLKHPDPRLIGSQSLYGTYYICTCESGLDCVGKTSIGDSILNKNFGICKDPNAKAGTI